MRAIVELGDDVSTHGTTSISPDSARTFVLLPLLSWDDWAAVTVTPATYVTERNYAELAAGKWITAITDTAEAENATQGIFSDAMYQYDQQLLQSSLAGAHLAAARVMVWHTISDKAYFKERLTDAFNDAAAELGFPTDHPAISSLNTWKQNMDVPGADHLTAGQYFVAKVLDLLAPDEPDEEYVRELLTQEYNDGGLYELAVFVLHGLGLPT
jgi:hypothetical protein